MILTAALLASAVLQTPETKATDENWPGWRGASGAGIGIGAPPVEWSEDKNVRWKIELPGKGISSPVVFDGRVYVTTAIPTGEAPPAPPANTGGFRGRGRRAATPLTEQDFLVVAIDHASGEVIWESLACTKTPHEGTHGDGSFATPTMVTDGEQLYASFGSVGIFAMDMEGDLVWERDLGDMAVTGSFGEGTSPVLAGDKLIVLWQHDGESFITALSTTTGETVWRTERKSGTAWCTPSVVETKNGTLAIVPGLVTTAYSVADGSVVWTHGSEPAAEEPTEQAGRGRRGRGGPGGGQRSSGLKGSAVVANGLLYFSTGSRRGSLIALHLEKQPEGKDQLAWSMEGNSPDIPSPIILNGTLFALRGNGLFSAMNALTGESYFLSERMAGLENAYASPVAAAGRIYCTDRDGIVEVIEAGKEFKSLAVNSLDDRFDASPAVVGDTLILRGHHFLYCIAKGE